MPDNSTCSGSSREQRDAEGVIRAALAEKLEIALSPRSLPEGPQLDGFADGPTPVLAEIWAHQGPAKSAQKNKVMADMCKLLLCERLLGKSCRKIVAVSDEKAHSFLENSWQGRFADEFGIERHAVDIPEDVRKRIRDAQQRQYR